jgi:hypothetical protein
MASVLTGSINRAAAGAAAFASDLPLEQGEHGLWVLATAIL